jgi:hypothetical protein
LLRLRKILPIHRAVTLGAFLDIEEAFDSTSSDIIKRQKSDMGLETIFQLVSFMLGDRYSEPFALEGLVQGFISSPLSFLKRPPSVDWPS